MSKVRSHTEKEERRAWFVKRLHMEKSKIKNLPFEKHQKKNWDYFFYLLKVFKIFIKLIGLKKRGYRNAHQLRVRYLEHFFDDLPQSFDGFKVMQLSDLHLDESNMITPKIEKILKNLHADICVMTGDYGTYHPEREIDHQVVLGRLEAIVKSIESEYQTLAILGNHDSCLMVESMEKMKLNVLINENFILEKNGESLQFIGVDDVHYFYSKQVLSALEKAKNIFSIGLVHSPEIFDQAESLGVNLYLTGHSHGGQICLPGEIPVITHLKRGKKFKKGLWKFKNMSGFTSNGIGCSGLFLRFNCPPEIVIHVLKRR